MARTTIPITLPNDAPIAIDGTNIPAGTLHPYEMTTRHIRIIVAKIRELTIRHCIDVLCGRQSRRVIRGLRRHSLADIRIISITLSKQDRHTLCHVDS